MARADDRPTENVDIEVVRACGHTETARYFAGAFAPTLKTFVKNAKKEICAACRQAATEAQRAAQEAAYQAEQEAEQAQRRDMSIDAVVARTGISVSQDTVHEDNGLEYKTAEPNAAFWELWRNHKSRMKEVGINVVKRNGVFQIQLMESEESRKILEEMRAEAERKRFYGLKAEAEELVYKFESDRERYDALAYLEQLHEAWEVERFIENGCRI